MEKFFQKYNWAINFVLIGIGSLLVALLINSFVAAQLADLTVPQMPSFHQVDRGEELARVDDDRDRWVDELAARCLFGCPEVEDPDDCPEGCPEGEVCEEGQCVPEEPEEDLDDEPAFEVPQLTELDVELTGVLATENPHWSVAMIVAEGGNQTHVVGVGEALPVDEPVEILEIRRDRVFIDNDGTLEFIRLKGSPYADPHEVEPPQRDDDEPRRGRQQPDRNGGDDETRSDRGVVEQGGGEYVIDNDRIDSELDNPESLLETARIMPNYTDGQADGLRLLGITPESFYDDIGIRSGDVLRTFNGEEITSQQQALEILETMGDEQQVTLEIERSGQRQQLSYTIR